jgi:beta-alanine--pyruvate transaminase
VTVLSDQLHLTHAELESHWMPFTANRQFKAAPRLLVKAEGMYYTTAEGRRILDGFSGLWCCNAGHCAKPIVEAIQAQAATMDYAPAFQMGHPLAFELANELVELAPGKLDHVFFCNSGSEAVDSALKIAIAWHRAKGEGQRTRLIGRERAYHGVGFGGMSVGGIPANRKVYGNSMLPGVAANPSGARILPTSSSASSRCTTHRRSPPSSSSPWREARAFSFRRRATCRNCARSRASTESFSSSTR